MKVSFWNACAVAMALAVTACGGSGGGATCSVRPCGGDVVGNWSGDSACLDQMTLNQQFLASLAGECPTASITNVTFVPAGTMAFAADLTYTASVALRGTMDLNMPASCLNGQTCEMVNASIQGAVGGEIQSASCVGSGSCVCTLHMLIELEASSGTYATSGTILALTATTGTSDSGNYCVQGSTLHLVDVDMTMPMGRVRSDIAFNKQ